MGRRVVNLIVCVVAFPFVYAAASLLRFAWAEAFVNNRSFTEYLGFIAGNTLLTWAFYFLFFFAVGVGVAALLRINRPLVWAACFGIAYSLFRLIAGTDHIIVPSTGLYVSIAGEYVMPVVGCMVGALLGIKLRGNGPSGSRAPDPISGST